MDPLLRRRRVWLARCAFLLLAVAFATPALAAPGTLGLTTIPAEFSDDATPSFGGDSDPAAGAVTVTITPDGGGSPVSISATPDATGAWGVDVGAPGLPVGTYSVEVKQGDASAAMGFPFTVEPPIVEPPPTPTATPEPTATPTPEPTGTPTPEPTGTPTPEPTTTPTATPAPIETPTPTPEPTATPTETPTATPTATPTPAPTEEPIETPTPTPTPTEEPVETPTPEPTATPTATPTEEPIETPTPTPTATATAEPTIEPTPSAAPIGTPTPVATAAPPTSRSPERGNSPAPVAPPREPERPAESPPPASNPTPEPAPTFVSPPATGTPPIETPRARRIFIRPFPTVRIAGTLTRSGARLRVLSVTAPAGARITARCLSGTCRGRVVRHRVRRAGIIRIRAFERALRAGTTITVTISAPGKIGKHMRFRVRRGAAPARSDRCLGTNGRSAIPCPTT